MAGELYAAQGTTLCGLARFDGSSGALDTRWIPYANHSASALAVVNGALYVGGSFATLSGQPRVGLAKLPLTSPFPERTWIANLGGGEYPWAEVIASVGSSIWVGGEFGQIGDQTRSSLAAVTPGEQTLFADSLEEVPSACVPAE